MDPSVEHLYDEYMDAAMAGRLVTPEEFLKDRGVSDDSLREVLQAVFEEHGRQSATHASSPQESYRPPRKSDVLGDFRLLGRLGEGGMGVVFLAEQISLRRRVAVKLLRPEIASSRAAATRFEREALAAARLNHPGIVSVIAVGEHRGARYIAMEYVEGTGLDEILKDAGQRGEPIAVTRAVRWCSQIARALAAAHAQGIIHRDVKPSNIRITPDDRALLLDFGVARDLDAAAPTLTETFIGSPFYAAPEQVAAGGGAVDGRTDVYAVGLVLYESITGTMPFGGGTLEQVLHAILTVEPPPPRRCGRSIPRDIDTVVVKAMDKNPARRYATAAALADDLDAVLELRPISARPHGRIERIARWARRKRPLAAAIATGAVALLLAGAVMAAQTVQRQRLQAAQTRALVQEASSLLDTYALSRTQIAGEESYYQSVSAARGGRYLTPEEDARVEAAEAKVRASRRLREGMFYRVLDLTSQAERAGASPEESDQLRARAYLQRYLEAELVRSIDQSLYRDLVLRHDPRGLLTEELRGRTNLELVCTTPGSSIHVFRRLYDSDMREGGERRLVMVPLRGWPEGVPQGLWALRIVSAPPPLRPGDHIIEINGHPVRGSMFILEGGAHAARGDLLADIDGHPASDPYGTRSYDDMPPQDPKGHTYRVINASGQHTFTAPSLTSAGIRVGDARSLAEEGSISAKVWTGGRSVEMTLPQGLSVRTTGTPLLASSLSLVDNTAAQSLTLEPGDYVVHMEAPGMESVRIPISAARGTVSNVRLALFPDGTSPPGFIRLADRLPSDLWVMEREVTFREYFEFLNDPQTLQEIAAASPQIIRFPYNGEEATGQRGPDGRFLLPDSWSMDWPALHVSWNDAKAYAAWKTRREQALGHRVEFDLPSLDMWVAACSPAGTSSNANYVFGDRFIPKWTSSCFARLKPWPEPVLSFPIDESSVGVFDLAGSVSEWTTSPWQPDLPHYRHAGGSWATGDGLLFVVYGGNGMLPDRNSGFIGFRLIMRPTEAAP